MCTEPSRYKLVHAVHVVMAYFVGKICREICNLEQLRELLQPSECVVKARTITYVFYLIFSARNLKI